MNLQSFIGPVKTLIEDKGPHLLLKSLDAIITVPLRSSTQSQALTQPSLILNASNYDRVASIAYTLDTLVPGTVNYVTELLCRSSKLPFGIQVEPMSYGTGSTVFLLKTEDKKKVLKIYRKSLRKNLKNIHQTVNWYRLRYEMVSSWYNGCFNLVPPATFLILHSPLLGSQAAAMLQPYIQGEKKDFFRDFSDEELLNLMRDCDCLRQQFIFFADQTFHSYKKQNLCFDFIGRENLVVVKAGEGWKLQVIDTGVFELDKITPAKIMQIEKYVSRLKFLKTSVYQYW